MANGSKKDITSMFKKLIKLRDKMTSKTNLQETGDFAVDLIKKRTRAGFGVSEHGSRKSKLDPLSDSYKKVRKKNKPKGPTTPSKSNLTHSGDMLDDLEAKASKGSASIGFSSKKSEDKAEWVSDKRPFNNLSKQEQKQIVQKLDKKAKEIIKK